METRSDDAVAEAVGSLVRGWIDAAGYPMTTIAKRAGVSASTLHRVLHDQVDPSLGTLREIAIACGVRLNLMASELCDPAAAAAARTLLEDCYAPALTDVPAWIARLNRQAGEDPVAITEAAGRASAPMQRGDTALFAGTTTVGVLASAGDASGARWALSGRAGLDLPDVWATMPAPTILWCENPRQIGQLLADSELVRTKRSDHATLAVVRADDALFTGCFTHERVSFVAPIQIVLDCFGIGGAVGELARREAQSWSLQAGAV